jgi:hypothetical protein
MYNTFSYYNSHMNSAVNYPGGRRETEIEYIFRIAREKADAEKAERRKANMAKLKASVTALFSKIRFTRTTDMRSALGS